MEYHLYNNNMSGRLHLCLKRAICVNYNVTKIFVIAIHGLIGSVRQLLVL